VAVRRARRVQPAPLLLPGADWLLRALVACLTTIKLVGVPDQLQNSKPCALTLPCEFVVTTHQLAMP